MSRKTIVFQSANNYEGEQTAMISRETIRVAEARVASHAAVFQIRAAEYDSIPESRPIARAIAAAELKRERDRLAWASERLATVRKYAAYEGIEGEARPIIAPWQPEPAAIDMPAELGTEDPIVIACYTLPADQQEAIDSVYRAFGIIDEDGNETPDPAESSSAEPDSPHTYDPIVVWCPRCNAATGEACKSKTGGRATAPHAGRVQNAMIQYTRDRRPAESRHRLPGGADNSRSGRMMQAREDAKHTNPADRTPAQDALIQIKPAYAALLAERYNLRQAEEANADPATITALRTMARDAEDHYNRLSAAAGI